MKNVLVYTPSHNSSGTGIYPMTNNISGEQMSGTIGLGINPVKDGKTIKVTDKLNGTPDLVVKVKIGNRSSVVIEFQINLVRGSRGNLVRLSESLFPSKRYNYTKCTTIVFYF